MPSRTVSVRRTSTSTPLARDHERFVETNAARKHRPIPWARFDRSRHPEAALSLALDMHTRLASGEYGAVSFFSLVASALTHNGAPLDLVGAAVRTAADELRHAEYALRMASLLAGHDVQVPFDRALFDRRFCHPIEIGELDAMMVEVPIIGETIAATLLAECRERATDPTAHAMLSSLLADEIHHARLGWYYLKWRAERWTRAEQQNAADVAGRLVQSSEWRFWIGRDPPRGARRAAWALGVLESRGQRAAIRRVMRDEIVPALDAVGLGASLAWRARRQGER